MPKPSGLFEYIRRCVADGSIRTLPLGSSHRLISEPSPYYLLFREGAGRGHNPFAERGFTFHEDGHLRIDRIYTASLDHRTLSYCHGTDYFVKGKDQKIIVHYYFDGLGYLTQFTCKLNGVKIQLNRAETATLLARATEYSDHVSALLQKHQHQVLHLLDRIKAITESITLALKKPVRDLDMIKNLLQQRTGLIATKDALSDEEVTAGNIDSFAAILQSLTTPAVAHTATTVEAEEETEDTVDETAEDLEALAVSTAAAPTPTVKSSRKAAKKKAAKKTYAPLKAQMEILLKQSAALDAKTPVNVLTKYLQEMIELRILLLDIPGDHPLQKDFDKLKTEIQLFVAALKDGNLAHIQALFPYCANQITLDMYHSAVYTWIDESRPQHQTIFKRRLSVFDYLHTKCPIFNTYMRVCTMSYEENPESGISYHILFMAYILRNEELFSALLRYGVNPHLAWRLHKSGSYELAMQVIIQEHVNTGFYVNELVRYGVSIKPNPRRKIIPLADLDKYKGRISAAQYRTLRDAFSTIQRQSTALRTARPDSKPKRDFKDAHGNTIVQCNFLQFIHGFASYHSDSEELFRALANNSTTDSLLLALTYVANAREISTIWISNARSSVLLCADDDTAPLLSMALNGVNDRSSSNNVSLVYECNGPETLDIRRTRFLVELINARFEDIRSEELEAIEQSLRDYVVKVAEQDVGEFYDELYSALNMLFIKSGSLNQAQSEDYMRNFATVGVRSYNLAVRIHAHLKQRLQANAALGVRTSAADLQMYQGAWQIKYAEAMRFLGYAVRAAYYTAFPEIRQSPIIDDCFTKIANIMTNRGAFAGALPAHQREYWEANPITREKMEADLRLNKPWLAVPGAAAGMKGLVS